MPDLDPQGITGAATTRALPRAILFDLDDTILAAGSRIDILRTIAHGLADALHPSHPEEIAAQLDAALIAFWSDPARHKIARLGTPEARHQVIADAFAVTRHAHLSPALAARFAARYSACRDQSAALFPGAREAVEHFKARGVLLALVTNGGAATQRAKIERFALAPLFDHIQIEGEHDIGKPDPRAYRHAMNVLGVDARDTWMVGDNLEWDVAAPQRLGIFAIWHDGVGNGLPAGSTVRPDRIITRISQMVGL